MAHDVADSTDWLATPLSSLMPIESSLRCQVCKDFYTTPMMTSCSHTFCSLCIRRYLSQEGKCPACREPDQEIRLRRNWAVQELVAGFVEARDGLLGFARAMAAGKADATAVYEDEPQPDGFVACPSCSRRIKEAVINAHLDRCLSGTAAPQPLQIQAGTLVYAQNKPSSMSRLPTINYNLLNESKLRSKLRDLGIRSTGSRELMSKRHTEWVNLWNANCDSQQQLSKRDLLRQLDTWERTQGRQIDHKEAGGAGVMSGELVNGDDAKEEIEIDMKADTDMMSSQRIYDIVIWPKPGVP
ncbi:hypothetical protein DV737_g920, partial [Chaetothyriales sp. CBS 132003]